MYGDSLGALIIWKAGLFVAVGAGLLGIFTVIRHTRADEEAGRLELVGADRRRPVRRAGRPRWP